jgi:hypothetical protein
MGLIQTSIQKEMEMLDEKERLAAEAKLSASEQQALQHYKQQLEMSKSPQSSLSSGLSGIYSGLGYSSPSSAYMSAIQGQMYQQGLQQAYSSGNGYWVTSGGGGGGGGSSTLTTGTGTYTATGTPAWDAYQTPYLNKEDGWDAEQSQEAVSHGWMLTEGDNDYPDLEAVSWGTKKHMNEKEILQDVLTMCLTGECPIAHKILHLLSKNRSPFAEYEKTVLAMNEDYANKSRG